MKLLVGMIGLAVSVVWIVHIVLYQLISPPASAFLNEVFVELDDTFPLFGTASFAFFCFYLLGNPLVPFQQAILRCPLWV